MIETNKFKVWHRVEIARKLGTLANIEERVNQEMKKIKIEVKSKDNKWIEWTDNLESI